MLSGTKPVVFLTGEAGMGKSTMLRGLKEEIARDHTAVRIADVDCSSPLAGINVGAVEALYPWIQMMRELAEEAPNTQTKKLVTDLARAWIKFIPIVGDLIESTVDTVSIVKEHRAASAPPSPLRVVNMCSINVSGSSVPLLKRGEWFSSLMMHIGQMTPL
ncbi:MAG: ATP-binding protein [Ignavibacteria bacterium]|nr:ATP-binding protein [Ignavibacteria bacterium]